MIKERYIREWNEFVPWKDMLMVEQDLIICRALVSIFSDDLLMKKLSDVLDEKQKLNKIGNLLTQLRVAGKIRVGERKRWRLM